MGTGDNHLQNHDLQVLTPTANVSVYVNDTLAGSGGWRGGQFVMYTSNTFGAGNNFKNVRVVGASDGTAYAGVLIRGSDFHPQVQKPGSFDLRNTEYNFSSLKPTNTRVVKMAFDGSYIFKVYEKYAFGDRTGGTALTYTLNQDVYVSDRGYVTTYADALASGIGTPVSCGSVWMVPSEDNHYRLGVDIF
jgi:hypothetical protein